MGEAKTIEELPGVGTVTAGKLFDAGFKEISSIAIARPIELKSAAGINESSAMRLIEAARDSLDMGLLTGKEVMVRRECIRRLTTGSSQLDNLLGGGVETQSLTEFYGAFGSGKTQICHQLCVNVQLPLEKGGLEKKAIYIDTENTFRPERIIQMAKPLGLNTDEVLGNIRVARAYTSDDQVFYTQKIGEMVQDGSICLVVVDSLTSQFRADYTGRGMLADRQQKLNRHLHDLQRMSDIHNVAVVLTNQVMARPDMFFGDPTAPVGGHIVGHSATFRIYLRKSKNSKRVGRLIDSPCLPEGEATFTIDGDGISD